MAMIGIMGGTFDPPHNGHLLMAERSLAALPLEKVLFMPAPNPPHKTAIAPYRKRLRMVELALKGRNRLQLSQLEEFRNGPSYTVDLLEFYRSRHEDDVYYILGSDSLAELGSWKSPRRILELATLVVFRRMGFPPFLPVPGEASMVLFDEPVMDISSSEIREKISHSEDVSSYLPDAVLDFILDNSLYSC